MAKSIRLYPEHGANASLIVCNWCREETGEIVVMGAGFEGEAPTHVIVNDQPCRRCQERMARGITIVEMTVTDKDAKRTGRWAVMKAEAVRRIIRSQSMLAEILQNGGAAVTPDVADALGLFDHEINDDDDDE